MNTNVDIAIHILRDVDARRIYNVAGRKDYFYLGIQGQTNCTALETNMDITDCISRRIEKGHGCITEISRRENNARKVCSVDYFA